MGAYGHVWEFASISEARRVIAATFWASAVLILITLGLGDFELIEGPATVRCPFGPGPRLDDHSRLPRSSPLSLPSLLFPSRSQLDARDRVLILGTSKRAAELARYTGPYEVDVVGFVSSGPTRRDGDWPTCRSSASWRTSHRWLRRLNVHQVIVASEGASVLARRLVDLCVDIDVRLRIVPDLDELLTGYDGGPDIRDLEIDDLLLRPSVTTDLEAVESILHGKTVLVTGAGGSIGSEIVNQVLASCPPRSSPWTTTRPISTTTW